MGCQLTAQNVGRELSAALCKTRHSRNIGLTHMRSNIRVRATRPEILFAFAFLLCAGPGNSSAEDTQPADAQLISPDINAMTLAEPWTVLSNTPPPITNYAIVDAPIAKAWELWTDANAVPEFMGFEAEIDLRPGGVYRVAFVPAAPTPIERGNDGVVIAMEFMRMLSVTWMTPMHMQELRGNSTSLTLYFTSIDGGKRTQVDLINTGYGTSRAWREAYDYNVKGWDRVLSHFQYAANIGPIDWEKRAADLKRDHTLPMWRSHKRAIVKGENPYPKKKN